MELLEGVDQQEVTLEDLKKQCISASQYWTDRANTLIPGLNMRAPELKFDLRGLCAGSAGGNKNERHIRINIDLLQRYPKEMLSETISHEHAHCVVGICWPDARPHGNEWKSVMKMYGKSPNRCHSMEVRPAKVTKKYLYVCGCPGVEHQLGSTRHKRSISGIRYRCTTCKTSLRGIEI